ncbi:DUF2283 domain-containing protein [Nocardia paucivorans]|uniref:DUF2283 domain-containing protein n=1 Tax=Nocardia paucivorans TaxID=114259 RepID=UPI0002D81D61|nr:DUF2283 domain-containing protein [Nocardia paucivorans]
MHATYDPEADAAYIAVKHPIGAGEAVRQQSVPIDNAEIVLDFDKDNRLLGVEILGAGGVLPAQALEAAQHPQ